MKTWMVVGPEVEMYPRSYDPPEPEEYGHDVVIVAAETRREARIEAVKAFRRAKAKYLEWGENPFRGLTIEEACCRHGVYAMPTFLDPTEACPCPACDDEWDSRLAAEMHAYNDGLLEYA